MIEYQTDRSQKLEIRNVDNKFEIWQGDSVIAQRPYLKSWIKELTLIQRMRMANWTRPSQNDNEEKESLIRRDP